MDAILSSKESLSAVINKLFTAPEDEFNELFPTLYSTKVQATVNGEHLDYDLVKAQFQKVRAGPKAHIEVVDLVREGKQYAWRHVGKGTLPDGKKLEVEIFLFGELDDEGKMVRQTENIRFA